jgi:Adenoviral fibre protein (repeat/shaft region).
MALVTNRLHEVLVFGEEPTRITSEDESVKITKDPGGEIYDLSVEDTLDDYATKEELEDIEDQLSGKQDALIEGTGIKIENNVISVINGGQGLLEVSHDNTLVGKGIEDDKLGVNTDVIATKYDIKDFVTDDDLEEYAKKEEIPDVSNFATKDEIPDVSNFPTKDEVASEYQPKGEYALVGDSYTKEESDEKYALKGDVPTAGDAIDITNDTISVKYGQGLELDSNNSLKVKLGKGLKFDNEAGVEGEISIDDIGQEVIEEVLELSSELDKKITTTFNYAQITSAEDFAPFGISGTTRMIGQLFAVPISSEIRENDTLICIRAKQGYSGKVSFGIFEFDFDGNDGSGSTTWLCDTGVVSVREGENKFPLKHIIPTSTVRPSIKMEPGKLYYATVMVANDAPVNGLFLASCPPYDQNYNATPKYTMVVSNMDPYVDWSIGTQRNTWFQGYNEFNNVPRLFMMIRNGEAAPVPTIDPFVNYESFTLEHRYHINDLFSLEFNVNNHPVLYKKIRPAQDCTITKIGWVDYHSGATYDYATDIPLMIDSNYTSMTIFGDNIESSSGTKIDGTHYYHEYTLSTPINLQADTNYFVPCNMNISGADSEWIITYSSPSGTSDDLILFDSKWNVASWAGNHAEYLSSQPGTLCRIVTSDNKTYTF